MTFHMMLAIGLTGSAALAAVPVPLEVTSQMLVERRVAATDGTTRVDLVAPGRVTPGDRVQFRIRYRNAGRQPLSDVVLANPVPSGLAYRGAGTGSPMPELSVDGRTFGPLAALRVTGGNRAQRPATLDDVVSVRWRLASPVAVGAQGQLTFQAVLR